MKNRITAVPPTEPVVAAHPTSGGTAVILFVIGGAADDDVLRRAPLQPQRVHEHVAEKAAERETRGERVDGK
jgi:hypothetical protein